VPLRSDQMLAGAILETVEMLSHGFNVREVLAHDGADWVLADASSQTLRARALVVEVIDVDNFVIAFGGLYEEDSAHGLTIGSTYYLSDTTPGALSLFQNGVIQQILTVITSTAYVVKLFELVIRPPYIFDRIDAAGVYYGYERQDDQRWLVKLLTIDGAGLVTEVYANEGNNGAYNNLNDAWTNRLTLTYEPFGDLVNV
jgi:hypothetical protein